MSIFKWHPLYACKFIPERTDEQRNFDAQVMAFKEKGAKLKKERQKARVKFRCPYIDPLTNSQILNAARPTQQSNIRAF